MTLKNIRVLHRVSEKPERKGGNNIWQMKL